MIPPRVEPVRGALARAVRAEAKARGRFERAERHWRRCQRRVADAQAALTAAPGATPHPEVTRG